MTDLEKKKQLFYKICMNLIDSRDYTTVNNFPFDVENIKYKSDLGKITWKMKIEWFRLLDDLTLEFRYYREGLFTLMAESPQEQITIHSNFSDEAFEKNFDKLMTFLDKWDMREFYYNTPISMRFW